MSQPHKASKSDLHDSRHCLEQLNVIIDYVLAVGCSTLSVLSSMYTQN